MPLDSEIRAVMVTVGPISPDTEDELNAYAPTRYLTELAGRGVEGDVDLSASCGCAESTGSGPGVSSGPGVTPTIDHKKKAILRAKILLKTD